MTVRTTLKSVTFVRPFTLGELGEFLPPGTYDVEIDEELLEGLSFLAYRRTLTLIHLPAKLGFPGSGRTLTVDPGELDVALERDAASAETSSEPVPGQEPFAGAEMTCEAEADRRAVDRAEDEGMIDHPH